MLKRSTSPLYSDVDGTLINSDLLIESSCALLKRQPFKAFAIPFWMLRGKAFLKTRVADYVELDPSTMPYNEEFVEFLRSESKKGREVFLSSASDERLVSAIAGHLGFVRGVMATTPGRNLKGKVKAQAIRAHCGEEGFSYAGNNRADLPVWREATEGILVNASSWVEKSARDLTYVEHVFRVHKAGIVSYLKTIRLHQWLKNVLVFVPIVVSHRWNNLEAVMAVVKMFFAFGFIASGMYMINDLLDLPSDRRHPSKRLRPIASGQIPLLTSALIAMALILLGAITVSMISIRAEAVLGAYFAATLAYSLYLKDIIFMDVVMLAGLYTLRIIAGAIAVGLIPSVWLMAFSGFMFLSLALLKRCVELDRIQQLNQNVTHGRNYRTRDTQTLRIMGISSGYVAILVVALYVDSSKAIAQYKTPESLWFICPLLLYWLSRMWIKAARMEMHDDPLVYSVRDRTSWIVFAAVFCTWLIAHLPF